MIVRLGFAGAAALLTLTLAGAAVGQAAPPADTLRLTPTWDVTRHQPREAPLVLTLSRRVLPEDGRLAVIVGRTDLSALLEVSGTRASLPLRGERLPAGDLEVVAYIGTQAGEWRELGRFALRRLTRAGFESAAVQPRLELQSDGQLGAQHPTGAPPGGRTGAYQDFALNGGIDANFRRASGEAGAQGLLLGATNEAARLRAAQLGSNAPVVDLASYNLRITRQRLGLSAGHIGLGNNRHLVNQFRSRGVSADVQLTRGVQATLAGSAGSEIVGWDDPLGLRRPAHRILAGSLGIEAAPSRPGLLRLDLTTLEGSVRPISAFNQAAITDRQESSGLGVQLAAALPSGRMRLAAGVARSRFANPVDPLLSGDSTLVPVRPETRNARFGELTFDVLRGVKLGPTSAQLSLSARHERIDPQYRSVAVAVQADREQNSVEANGALGVLQLQLAVTSAHDNLDGIASLLTTQTDGQSLSAALPLAPLLRASLSAWWWPSLTLGWQSVNQTGGETPANGGFRFEFQVPDQRTSNLTLGAGWQHAAWQVAWRFGHSLVDNRQPERERSDFATDVHGVTFGLTSARLTLAADLAHETLRSVEVEQHTRNQRVSLQAGWRPFGHAALSGAYSLSTTDDQATTLRGRNSELRLEASQGFNLYTRPQGGSQARVFLRYARTSSAVRTAGVLQPAASLRSLNCGLSLRLF